MEPAALHLGGHLAGKCPCVDIAGLIRSWELHESEGSNMGQFVGTCLMLRLDRTEGGQLELLIVLCVSLGHMPSGDVWIPVRIINTSHHGFAGSSPHTPFTAVSAASPRRAR